MNRFQPEQATWETALREHVNALPPYITAEYRYPDEMTDHRVRLRPVGDESGYEFEVSAPDAAGDVTLAATKTFYDERRQQVMTESSQLQTYQAEGLTPLDPHMAALDDARGLIFEWGKHDLEGAMGSAFKLAQANGHTGQTLFDQGPPDPFTPTDAAREMEAIQAEREREQEQELRQSLEADLGGVLPRQQVVLRSLPIHDPAGQTLGHAAVGVDMAWSSGETQLADWERADMGVVHELAHFKDAEEARDYVTALDFYFQEHNLPTYGDVLEVAPAARVLEMLSEAQGFSAHAHYLEPSALGRIQAGDWQLEHPSAEFKPISFDAASPNPEMEL